VVEAEQMVAIKIGFGDPQFADPTTIGQRFFHCRSPLVSESKPFAMQYTSPGCCRLIKFLVKVLN